MHAEARAAHPAHEGSRRGGARRTRHGDGGGAEDDERGGDEGAREDPTSPAVSPRARG